VLRHEVACSAPGETPSVNLCLRSVSKGVVAVGLVGCFVVVDAFGEAVPEDVQPAVAQGAQSGMVAFARGDFLIINSRAQALWVRLQKAHWCTASPR
jgi:hypothetical protein